MKTRGRIPYYVYSRCTILAKAYYDIPARLREIDRDIIMASAPPGDGMPRGNAIGDPTSEKALKIMRAKEATERQYKALQDAFDELPDEFSRELIDKNLFRGIPMDYVVVPMSERQKKRVRSGFIRALAEKLEEI